ncbi:MAG: hypothetical protein V4795_00520 [Pseudomonadota bacterium]
MLRLVDAAGAGLVAVELLARATRRASCWAWSSWPHSIAPPASAELHQAEPLQGLRRAELLPLVLGLVGAAGVELQAVELLTGGNQAAEPLHRVELLALSDARSRCCSCLHESSLPASSCRRCRCARLSRRT